MYNIYIYSSPFLTHPTRSPPSLVQTRAVSHSSPQASCPTVSFSLVLTSPHTAKEKP